MKRRSRRAGDAIGGRRRMETPKRGVRAKSARQHSAYVANVEAEVGLLSSKLEETLDQQTATADLLSVISRSKFALQPVLQTIVDAAVRLCRATSGEIFRLEKGVYHFEVGCNLDPAYVERQKPITPGLGTMVGRTAISRKVVPIDDLLSDPAYELKEDAKISGARSMIGVPLMRDGEPIGVIILARHRVEPFGEREIKLVTTFADKAVIAIGARERESQLARQARSAEQALDLLVSVSTVAGTAVDLRHLAMDCLVQACKSARCEFGQLWYPEPSADVIKCFAGSYFGGPRFADLHLSNVKLEFQKGDNSIPGRVWQTQTPLWIDDLGRAQGMTGIEAARAAGFRFVLAAPIIMDNSVFVIFELYSTNTRPVDQTVMTAVVKLGKLLGDILQRKRSELALRTAHSELARVSQFSAMGVMTASIGHEIRQPLAAMAAQASAGLRWISRSPPDLEETKACLRSIVQEGQRASDILETVRAMFRKQDQEVAAIDINQLIGEVLEFVQSEVQKQRVSLHTELAHQLPNVMGNRIQLQQVILNLTINAIEAMVSTEERERALRVKSVPRAPHGVLIAVEDSGTGIDPQNVNRVFDFLYTTKSNGMGMGLSICQSIIEAHRGRLWVSAGIPHGSVFHVLLPTASAGALG
jgi:signal transduction histidine kinase